MNKRILILGSVVFLTACSSVELVGSGTEANSKVPVSIEGYNLITPAMASSGFCKGVPAVEGPMFEGSITSSSTFLYLKDGFTLPTSADPFDCEGVVRLEGRSPGIIQVSAYEYPEGVPRDNYQSKCENGSDSMEGQIFCNFPEENYSYAIIANRIGSLESQQAELGKVAGTFDKNAELNIPEP